MGSDDSVLTSVVDEQGLANLVDELTRRLESGEPLTLEDVARQHSRYAERLQRLWPVLQTMSALPHQVGELDLPGNTPLGQKTDRVELGDYRLLREIGRGGMGVVYEAEQLSLGRRVAVKVLMYAAMLDRRQLARFQSEVRVASRLQHQNIVPVFGVGVDRGVHYYAMQYVDGCTLADVIERLREKRGPRPQAWPSSRLAHSRSSDTSTPAAEPDRRALADTATLAALTTRGPEDGRAYFHAVARWGIQAAEALEHAHSQGIVHRDVKPANILLEDNGHLWITDFGLARIEANAGLTGTGDVLGTPRYMSPEQAEGRNVAVDEQTDIYSLGVTLYELLTLRAAFDDASRKDVLRKIVGEDPPRPRRLQQNIPLELETIVLKAMEKSPVDRYATAIDIADDLRRFLDERPIQAQRPTLLTIARKWCRRHRSALSVAAGLAILFLTLAAGILAHERQRIQTAWSESERHRQEAEANLDLARQTVDDMYSGVAQEWLGQQPRLQEKQKQFLEKAAQFYEKILLKAGRTDEDRFAATTTLCNLGDIERDLGQYLEARERYRSAHDIVLELTREFPANDSYLRRKVRCLNSIASLETDPGRKLETLRSVEQSYGEFNRRFRDNPAVQLRLALSKLALRDAVSDEAQKQEFLAEAISIAQRLSEKFPDGPDHKEAWQNIYWATEQYDQLVEPYRELVRLDPSPGNQTRLSYVLQNLGAKDVKAGRFDDALDRYREAAQLMESLYIRFPDIVKYAADLGNLSYAVHDICLVGDRKSTERAIDILEGIHATHVNTSEVVFILHYCYSTLAFRFAKQLNEAELLAIYYRASRLLTDETRINFALQEPGNEQYQQGPGALGKGVASHLNFGLLFSNLCTNKFENPELAIREFELGHQLAADPRLLRELDNSRDGLVNRFHLRMYLAQLYAYDSKGLATPEQLLNLVNVAIPDGHRLLALLDDPKTDLDGMIPIYLAQAYEFQGSAIYATGGDPAAYRAAFEEALRILRENLRRKPDDWQTLAFLSEIEFLSPVAGPGDLKEALAIADRLAVDEKTLTKDDRNRVASIWGNLGWGLYRLDRLSEAEQAFDRCLSLHPEHSRSSEHDLGAAIVMYRLGKHDEALRLYKDAVCAITADPWLHSWQQVALQEADRVIAAK